MKSVKMMSHWSGLGSVQYDSCPNKKKRDLDRHKDNAMSVLCPTGAEIEVIYLQAKEHLKLPKANKEARKTFSLKALRKNQLRQPCFQTPSL